jgi:hypothetical protein
MLILDSTSDVLQVITGTGVSTINVHASYVDLSGSTATPGNQNTQIATAATTTVVSSPAASTARNVKALMIYNSSATATLITVQINSGSLSVVFVYNLQPGETIQYFEGMGFEVIDAAGGRKVNPAVGRLLAITLHTTGSSHTMQAATTMARIRLIGGGGGGAGEAGNSGNGTFGAGGAGGGYTEVYTPVKGGAAYTYAIGALGGGGTNAANGANGGNTSWTGNASNATVVWTAQGGANGQFMANGAAVAVGIGGAATPANATNSPTLSVGGNPGGASYRVSSTQGWSGAGGASGLGYGAGGGSVQQNAAAAGVAGDPGKGYGGGGGGAGGNSNANGGAGTVGCVIVEEYS